MTVKELIRQLRKIEDKTKEVCKPSYVNSQSMADIEVFVREVGEKVYIS